MLRCFLPLVLACAAAPAAASPRPLNPQIDYDGYRALIEEVRPYRLARLIDWDAFIAAAGEPDVLILDARSAEQFAAGHIRGAVNVPLPEFSDERLAEVIGRADRPILIYCNNNFRNDRPPVMLKTGAARAQPFDLHPPLRLWLSQRARAQRRDGFQRPRVRWVRNSAPRASQSGMIASPRSSIRRCSTARPSVGIVDAGARARRVGGDDDEAAVDLVAASSSARYSPGRHSSPWRS